jgi:hypothetical protein
VAPVPPGELWVRRQTRLRRGQGAEQQLEPLRACQPVGDVEAGQAAGASAALGGLGDRYVETKAALAAGRRGRYWTAPELGRLLQDWEAAWAAVVVVDVDPLIAMAAELAQR